MSDDAMTASGKPSIKPLARATASDRYTPARPSCGRSGLWTTPMDTRCAQQSDCPDYRLHVELDIDIQACSPHEATWKSSPPNSSTRCSAAAQSSFTTTGGAAPSML
jgi:hypothetical protein